MLLLLCLHVVFQFVLYVESHLVHLVVGKLLKLLDILHLLVSQLSLDKLELIGSIHHQLLESHSLGAQLAVILAEELKEGLVLG